MPHLVVGGHIYTNDIFLEIADSEKMYMYADDTLLVNKGKDENIAVQNSQICLNKIIDWCKLNKLTLNENKTKHLCISNRKNLLNLKVDAGGTYLGNVDNYDYLGFCIDRKLNMNSHIDKIMKKVGFKLHTMSLMRPCL